MEKFGQLLQYLGFFAGAISIAAYAMSYKDDSGKMQKYGNMAFLVQGGLITIASILLTFALVDGYFAIDYVFKYTDKKLPLLYKISGLWAGQAGSLLFWGWLVTIFGAIEMYRLKKADNYKTSVMLVSVLTSTFFVTLIAVVPEANPFRELDPRFAAQYGRFPADGLGMNPLLQNPGMLYHPPTLYLGFVGFTIPVGHAFAAMLKKDNSASWAKDSRAWSIFAWVFLTIGIVLGGQWAYVELGWGGYWAWDPVENASLLPWFTATAFLHSAIVYERKGKLKIWSIILILLTYELCIFGTYITRSGVLDSVHAFGKSSLGYFLMVHMIASIGGYLYLLSKRYKLYMDADADNFSLTSKEGLFFISNWLFVGLMLVVLVGTMMPVISKLPFFADSMTLGIPYYNKVSTPFFMAILVLAGIAPHISFGKAEKSDYTTKLALPFVAMIASMGVIYAMGYQLPLPLLLFGFTTFSFVTIIMQMIAPIKRSGFKAVKNGMRFYGALLVHLGVVLMAYGVIASSFYNSEIEKVVHPGESFQFKNYTLKVGEVGVKQRQNYSAALAPVTIYKDGKKVVTLAPERRFYEKNEEAFAEVALRSTLKEDLYLILASYSKPENYVGIQAVYQPLIMWIWIGCAVMVLGGFVGLGGRPRKAAEESDQKA